MKTNPQLEYVKVQMEQEINIYTIRKHFNRRAAFAFTVVPATLAAFATVAIGAADKLKLDWLPLLAMMATGIASILGVWEALFANRKLWRTNNAALTGLYALKSDIEFRELDRENPITQDEVNAFYDLLKSVRKEGEVGYLKAVGHE